MNKESFLIYTSFYKPISLLSDEQLGRLFRAIFLHNLSEVVSVDNDIQMAFEFFKNQFNIDEKKYREKIEKRAEAGKKGMEKRWGEKLQKATNNNKDNKELQNITNITNDNKDNKELQNITNITNDNKDNYNVNVNVNVNDNENDNDNVNVDKEEKDREKEISAVAPINKKKTLEERENIFREDVKSGKYKNPDGKPYNDKMLDDFLNYWTEPTPGRTRMKFEGEKTWETSRRLRTWYNNQIKFGKIRADGTDPNYDIPKVGGIEHKFDNIKGW